MALKNATLLALIGMIVLTVILLAGLILDILNVSRGLIAPTMMVSALVRSFAAVTVTVFLYVFRRTQS
jgi:hypothetical protein